MSKLILMAAVFLFSCSNVTVYDPTMVESHVGKACDMHDQCPFPTQCQKSFAQQANGICR